MQCTTCDSSLHLGKCSGVTEAAAKNKAETFFQSWQCPTCYANRLRSSGNSKDRQPPDVYQILAAINAKLDKLDNLAEKVDGIEKAISLMSDKYDEVLQAGARHDAELKELRKRIEVVEAREGSVDVQQLKLEVNDLEWRSRRHNLVIHGVHFSENEDLLCKVNAVGRTVELPNLSMHELEALHRLPSKPEKVPGILIRFAQLQQKENWLRECKKLRGLQSKVLVTENLTQQNRRLLFTAKKWAKENGFEYAWHSNGKVLVRRASKETIHVIRVEDDLAKLVS